MNKNSQKNINLIKSHLYRQFVDSAVKQRTQRKNTFTLINTKSTNESILRQSIFLKGNLTNEINNHRLFINPIPHHRISGTL